MIRLALTAALALLSLPALAAPWPELKLVAEHPVEGMRGGNLSGLSECRGGLWAVSDRDDELLYRLETSAAVWQAESVQMEVPPVPDSGLPWGLRSRTWAASQVRGGELDFEGISCDAAGNHYLVSEAHAAVLQVPVEGSPNWLKIDPSMVRQARASGMLLHFNALFEGLAVSSAGDRIWLAAERERRGLLLINRQQTTWNCGNGCVLLSEAGVEMQPAQMAKPRPVSRDFADLALFNDKLFTLERNAYRICRRDAQTAKVERCWSFAADALAEPRRYSQPFGLAEALVIDAKGAWIGLDNNGATRQDGESRPIVWRFAAPAGGWSAKS
ncbi:esterase-like activity of phytase family protein [Pseudomonas rubra]|uniref:Esterase-like activity of phytase family protein n=1 Tax=Pseudomonas rubra TaxID=2942627 RepID=A0ABT5P7B4_9PSED|nr:esterase-like activity of phytase family protein [Pseudomonas rubra]MDD1014153.1 esterase-like activity of phytase family protein [Pseudomonas rubra]MDD1039087.1 esterase-like activity of phytase family protein [Pseudomonas rubra]MDD1154159.1 esterase-like activity of phytase family protein [Pseudomonas rubra]